MTPPRHDQPAMTDRQADITLEPTRAAVRAARRFVDETLEAWDRGEVADDACLVVSELVTNAVLHANTRVLVCLVDGQGVIRVEVSDESSALPNFRRYTDTALTGRGLHLVEAMSLRWGVEPGSGGKLIWAELGLGADHQGSTGSTGSSPGRPGGLSASAAGGSDSPTGGPRDSESLELAA